MSEIFNPNYPAKFTQEDVENGHVNSDGTINFGSSSSLIVKNTDGRFETLPDTYPEYCFIVSDALFDKMVETFLSGEEVKVMSHYQQGLNNVNSCGRVGSFMPLDAFTMLKLRSTVAILEEGIYAHNIISESTYERLMEE